jgi:hypothetical protein
MRKDSRSFRILIVLLIVCALFLVVFAFIRSQQFRLVSSTPGLGGDIATSTGTIRLSFSDELKARDYVQQLEGKDSSLVNSVRTDKKALFLSLKPLKKNQRYSFTLKDIQSIHDKKIDRLQVTFTAHYIPYDKLSAEQKALELSQTDRANTEDPIVQYLPYQGDGYYLTGEHTSSEDGEPIFILNAQLFLTRPDLTNKSAAISKYKEQVNTYIRSKNLSPDKYLVRFIINEPPAQPN